VVLISKPQAQARWAVPGQALSKSLLGISLRGFLLGQIRYGVDVAVGLYHGPLFPNNGLGIFFRLLHLKSCLLPTEMVDSVIRIVGLKAFSVCGSLPTSLQPLRPPILAMQANQAPPSDKGATPVSRAVTILAQVNRGPMNYAE
jgi:hypothetical protein